MKLKELCFGMMRNLRANNALHRIAAMLRFERS